MGWGSASTHEVEEGQEVPQPELHEKLQAHVNRLAETAVRANEARWQAANAKIWRRQNIRQCMPYQNIGFGARFVFKDTGSARFGPIRRK